MNIVTSWIEQGIEQSRAREATLLVKMLRRHIGAVSATSEQAVSRLSIDQLEQLGEALFDFSAETDLLTWLENLN
jgi:Domain of unknown function (DUF4351)